MSDTTNQPRDFCGNLQLCEVGNFSIHMALRNLRPPGTKVRKIPQPDNNPLTGLFK